MSQKRGRGRGPRSFSFQRPETIGVTSTWPAKGSAGSRSKTWVRDSVCPPNTLTRQAGRSEAGSTARRPVSLQPSKATQQAAPLKPARPVAAATNYTWTASSTVPSTGRGDVASTSQPSASEPSGAPAGLRQGPQYVRKHSTQLLRTLEARSGAPRVSGRQAGVQNPQLSSTKQDAGCKAPMPGAAVPFAGQRRSHKLVQSTQSTALPASSGLSAVLRRQQSLIRSGRNKLVRRASGASKPTAQGALPGSSRSRPAGGRPVPLEGGTKRQWVRPGAATPPVWKASIARLLSASKASPGSQRGRPSSARLVRATFRYSRLSQQPRSPRLAGSHVRSLTWSREPRKTAPQRTTLHRGTLNANTARRGGRSCPGRGRSGASRVVRGTRHQVTAAKRPSKLLRIGGMLYKVAGSGGGRTLRRQETLKPVLRTPRQASKYVRKGGSLVRIAAAPASSNKEALAAKALQRAVGRLRPGSAAKSSATKARQAASRASVAATTRKRSRFVNTPCPAFCRMGKCAGKEKGTCSYIHDPTKVAVCQRWLLLGSCKKPGCPLQHTARPELMPLCSYFLQGGCSNADCPYLHVKLDPKAEVCKDFMSGYCKRGAACPRKHLTPRMIQELRSSRTLQAQPQAVGASQRGAGEHGHKRKRGDFEAGTSAKRAIQDADGDTAMGDAPGVPSAAVDYMRPAFLRGL